MDLELPKGIQILDPHASQVELNRFLAEAPMNAGGLELYYDRSPDFFALLSCRGDQPLAICTKKEFKDRSESKFSAVAAITVSNRVFNGEKVKCAYLGDFRTDRSPRTSRSWRSMYEPLIRGLKASTDLGHPQYFLTAILKQNRLALANLLSKRRELAFRYDEIAELNMVNVFGKNPMSVSLTRKPAVMRATSSNESELREFLLMQSQLMAFGDDWSDPSEFGRRVKNWRGFALENFLIQKDAAGKIVACTFPWDPTYAKRMRVGRIPKSLRVFGKVIKILGIPFPKAGGHLPTVYLTHLLIDSNLNWKRSVVSFVHHVQRQSQELNHANTIVSFAEDSRKAHRYSEFIYQKTPVSIFNVALKDDPKIDLKSQPFHFEMSLV